MFTGLIGAEGALELHLWSIPSVNAFG